MVIRRKMRCHCNQISEFFLWLSGENERLEANLDVTLIWLVRKVLNLRKRHSLQNQNAFIGNNFLRLSEIISLHFYGEGLYSYFIFIANSPVS